MKNELIFRASETRSQKPEARSQNRVRRSVQKIIAKGEGFTKRGSADKLRYLNISQGSVKESRYYLILTKYLNYAETKELRGILEEIIKMLAACMKAIAS